MTSVREIKVRGYHLDFYGHINNARYLEFLEEGRWALFEDRINLNDWQKKGYSFFVVNININYRRPATLGDILEVRSSISKIGKRSGVIRQEIVFKGTDVVAADADVTFVIADSQTGKAISMSGEIRSQFEAMMSNHQ